MLMQALSYMKIYDPDLMMATDDWILQNFFDLNIQVSSSQYCQAKNLYHDYSPLPVVSGLNDMDIVQTSERVSAVVSS